MSENFVFLYIDIQAPNTSVAQSQHINPKGMTALCREFSTKLIENKLKFCGFCNFSSNFQVFLKRVANSKYYTNENAMFCLFMLHSI